MSVQKPTIVLVHGAFADSSSWNGVVPKLREQGYQVLAAPNPLRGIESDAEYVSDFVNGVSGPVVLAGHSYGGVVISRAAATAANVKALVYIAAFQPEAGESVFELSGRFEGSKLGPDTTNVLASQGELSIKPENFSDVFAADVPAETADVMAVTQRPVTERALAAPFDGEPAWKTVPSWALIAEQDHAIPAAAQEFMSERAGSEVTRVDASHAVSVSRPDVVAEVILAAAAKVA
jgi:pimeloyl-ACP methyl ester carboxylesterase